MSYEILKDINDETKIAMKDNDFFILKEISFEDTEIYKKLVKISNPNVVKFYPPATINDKFYAVEEFIHGITLAELMENIEKLDDTTILQYMTEICNGLKDIHSLGIVHRDINPNNIMITKDNHIKIIDFGISRTVKLGQSKDTQILGTQGYAAPEQFGFCQTSPKSDIYSLGVLLNYMATKHIPSEKLSKGIYSEVIVRCTQIDENNRYENIDSLLLSLEKKMKISKIIKTVPGFRKGNLFHACIAVIYYINSAVFLIFSLIPTENCPLKRSVLQFIAMIFMLVIPVPIITDYKNYTRKIPFFIGKSKAKKALFKMFFASISVIISCVFIIASTKI